MQKGESLRTTILCVDSYEDAVPSGRFYHLQLGEGKRFHGLIQLLISLEQKFDEVKFPQAFDAIRVFAPPKETNPRDENSSPPSRGKLATFSIRILFRQNASWQGSILWIEGNEEESFRSVLELIFLIDSALRQSNNSCQEAYPHSE